MKSKFIVMIMCFAAIRVSAQFTLSANTDLRGRAAQTVAGVVLNTAVPRQQENQWINNLPLPNAAQRMAPCSDTLLFENFQSRTISGTWVNMDIDGKTDASGRPMNWYIFTDLQTTTPGDTNYVAASSSWFNPVGRANNWLITPAIAPCANTVLRWLSAPFEGPTFMDGYKVLVSTTGTSIGDFTDTIFVVAEDVSGTGTAGPGTVHTNYNAGRGVLQLWQVSLGAYDNQTIHIAFVHDSNDDNLLILDNIFAGALQPYDLELLNMSNSTPYRFIPQSQVEPMIFSGSITVNAVADVNNPKFSVGVVQNGITVFSDSAGSALLMAGSTNSYTTTGYTPTTTGLYNVAYSVSAQQTDPDLSNNSDSSQFVVTDTVYALDNSIVTGTSLSVGQGAVGILANRFKIVNPGTLTSVTFFLIAPTLGDTLSVVVYRTSGVGMPTTLIGGSANLIITDTTQSLYTLPISGGPLTLNPGNYVVGLREFYNARATLATSAESFVPGLSWVFFNNTWATNETYAFRVAYILRANIGMALPVGITSVETDEIEIYPVPARDNLIVGNLADNKDYTIEMINSIGQTVALQQTSGLNQVAINVSAFAPGFYYIRVRSLDVSKVKPVVIY